MGLSLNGDEPPKPRHARTPARNRGTETGPGGGGSGHSGGGCAVALPAVAGLLMMAMMYGGLALSGLGS